ncbi:MAG: zf-HC2 domain-containing protein [Chloroflexi bacterium]|nr:zf-HC2 domain-containing protein [Chloroflexota bacterium]
MVSRIVGMFKRHRMDDDCLEVRERSSDLVDGDIDESIERRIRGHLARCGPCNAFINTLRATVAMLRSTPRKEPSEGFQARVLENLKRDQRG